MEFPEKHEPVAERAAGAYMSFAMIYPYSNETQTRWDRGNFEVRIDVPTHSDPIAFCDGTDADIAELRSRAEAEGADGFRIERKALKTGREIWTVHTDQ